VELGIAYDTSKRPCQPEGKAGEGEVTLFSLTTRTSGVLAKLTAPRTAC
jgi:hypothetical protein